MPFVRMLLARAKPAMTVAPICVARWGLGAVLFVAAAQAAATDIVVTRFDDPAPGGCIPTDCSLREAVILANALVGPDTIHLAAGAYQLTIPGAGEDLAATGDLDVRDDLSIVGAGQAQTAIVMSGQLDRVIQVYYDVNNGVKHTLNLSDLSVSGGYAHGDQYNTNSLGTGGCIFAVGEMNLTNVTIGNCQADVAGGLHLGYGNASSLQNVTITNNSAANFAGGAEIISLSAPAAIRNLVVTNNQVTGYDAVNPKSVGGLRVFMPGAGTSIDHVTVTGNSAQSCGGAEIAVDGTAQLSAFTIDGNTAYGNGGGLCLSQTISDVSADLRGFTITNNHAYGSGGGVYVELLADFPVAYGMRLHNAAISGNIAGYGDSSGSGGAIAFALCSGCDNSKARYVAVMDSSVHDNAAHTYSGAATPGGYGGGVSSELPIIIVRSTFASNTADLYGGAAHLYSSGPGIVGASVIQASTFSGNATAATSGGTGGGAIFATLTAVDISNSTFDADSSLAGGVLYNTGANVIFSQSTLYKSFSNPAGFVGSLIAAPANNSATTATSFVNSLLVGTCWGVAPSAAIGDIEAGNGFTNSCNLTGSSIPNVATQNLKLGSLADNGGPTLTRVPGASSVAIAAADATHCVATDQRGFQRQDPDVCDAGAVQTAAIDDYIFASGFELN